MNVQATRARLQQRLSRWANDTLAVCQAYEAPPSESYVRTGTLGKSWSKRVNWQGADLVAEVKSSGQVAPYNKYVRGPKLGPKKQAARMAARGWKSVSDIAEQTWPAAEADLQRILAHVGAA